MVNDEYDDDPNPMELLCNAYLDGGLNDFEIKLMVRLALTNTEFRRELKYHLFIHDGLELAAARGWLSDSSMR